MDTVEEVLARAKQLKSEDQYITTKLRAMCREGFEASLPSIVAIAKGEHEDSTPAIQIRAHDNLGKYAMSKNNKIYLENFEWLKTLWLITARYLADREKFIAWAAEVNSTLQQGE